MITLIKDEINLVSASKNNDTVSVINQGRGFQLIETPWFLAGIVLSAFFAVSLNVYCCYKIVMEGNNVYRNDLLYAEELGVDYGYWRNQV